MAALHDHARPPTPEMFTRSQPAMRLIDVDHIRRLPAVRRGDGSFIGTGKFKNIMKFPVANPVRQVIAPDFVNVMPPAAQRGQGLPFRAGRA